MSNKIYFTPGPSQLFYSFQDHLRKGISLDIPSVSHRSNLFVETVTDAKQNLRELLDIPQDFDIFFLSSANEAWDRIIQNLVINSSHHFVNGAFSQKFYDFAIQYGMKSTRTAGEDGVSFQDLSVPNEAELIGITKNETSTGFTFSDEDLRTIRTNNPDKLIALDVVSSAPGLKTDFESIDCAYFSVQKGFGMPPGLGVLITNQRCQERAEKKSQNQSIGSYRSLPNLKKFGDQNQTPETPNTLYIYVLGKILGDMLDMGQQRIVNDTIYKSTILYQTIANHANLTPFVQEKDFQSKTTVVVNSDNQSDVIDKLHKKGLVIGTGYGQYKSDHLRFANFPTHSREVVEMLCDYLTEIE